MRRRSISAKWLQWATKWLHGGALVAICVAPACGAREAGRVSVAVDQVVAATPAVREALAQAVEAALGESAAFVGEAGLGGALHLVAWVSASDQGGRPGERAPAAVLPPGKAVPSALFLSLELEVPASLRPQFDVPTIVARTPLTSTEPTPAMLAAAATEALQTLALRLRLAQGEPEAAALLLRSEASESVLLALEWTRDHPDPQLADAVAAQVESVDPEVVRLAIEVLAEVGEARHAAVVVRRVERSPALAREGYSTLAMLGGPDAIGYLQFAAANEDERELRRQAEHALAVAVAGSRERVASRPHGVDLPRVARGHRQ